MGNRQKLDGHLAAGAALAPSRDEPEIHRSHKDVAARLRRAEGHLRNVISMIEGGRGCAEIAQQMHAVIRAIECAKGVSDPRSYRPLPRGRGWSDGRSRKRNNRRVQGDHTLSLARCGQDIRWDGVF